MKLGEIMKETVTTFRGWVAILATAMASQYWLSKFDILPDITPLVGYVDDVVFTLLAIWALTYVYGKFLKKKK